jgi:hypothetical protein
MEDGRSLSGLLDGVAVFEFEWKKVIGCGVVSLSILEDKRPAWWGLSESSGKKVGQRYKSSKDGGAKRGGI